MYRRLLVVLPAIICLCCHTRRQADPVTLDKDLMKIPSSEILQTKVISTYSSGVKVY
jgi:hypothetical protein